MIDSLSRMGPQCILSVTIVLDFYFGIAMEWLKVNLFFYPVSVIIMTSSVYAKPGLNRIFF